MKDMLNLHNPIVVGNPKKHYIRFCIYMFLFWLLITQSLAPKMLIMGALASVVVSYVCMPLFLVRNYSQTKSYFAMDVNIFKFIAYVIWLMKELILANIDVAKAIVKKSLPIEPQIIKFKAQYDNPVAKVLLANSITLTPGTITLHVDKNCVYVIHALTPGAADGIRDGAMLKKVAALFNESAEFEILEDETNE